jgi:DNA-binding HxlR family transcriptional regulator
MEVLAKPWSGILIAALEDGPLRFSELGERVSSIGDRMLALRLRELETRGLVQRTVIPGSPVRVEYALTDAGRGFRDVSEAVQRWGDQILRAKGDADAGPERSGC